MKKTTSLNNALPVFLFIFMMLITASLTAQVGIGTVTPDASSVLDVSSTTQGMLAPRMTTTQKNAIAAPADGLMVYDLTLKSLSYFNSSSASWNSISGNSSDRLKFKRIKSTDVLATVLAAEKTAGGNTKYLLNSETLYEINGTINVDLPIDLNNAYIAGLDSGDDKLVKTSGDLFVGSTGGSIRVVTLTASAGKVFNLVAGSGQSIIIRDAIVAGSSQVGNLENFALTFMSIVQFAGNANGIVYKNINKLLLSNMGWFGNNSGTFEKVEGTFDLIQKTGGFLEVTGDKIGFDVSANPVINNDAVMRDVVFTGILTNGKYVNGYTIGSYSGYSFNNKWMVNSAGIPREDDLSAVGDFYYNYGVGSGVGSTLNSSPSKLSGVSLSDNLYRFSRGGTDNRITYIGNKKRFFRATGTVSFQADASGVTYIFYIAKNGVVINKSKVYIKANSTSDLLAIPLNVLTEMSPNDYLEVFAERFTSGTGTVTIATLNLFVF
ncbi:MAG: hypothetical protein K2Y30_07995 [Flavobacteriaceae bacterium]|nr:hypothetical protein [Flavobacteriaceae bacterium]